MKFSIYLNRRVFVMWTCAPKDDSDQPAHSRSLGVTWRILDSQGCEFLVNNETLMRLVRMRSCFKSSLGVHVINNKQLQPVLFFLAVIPRSSHRHANIILTPLKPHFYIVKMGFTGVYFIFLNFAQKRKL